AQGMLDTGHVSVELDVAACGGSSYGNRLVSTAGSPNPVSITGPNFSQIDAIAVHAQVQAYPGDSAPGNLIMKWSALEVTFMDCTGNSDPKTMIDCVPITAELIPNPKQVVTGSATIVVVFRPTPPFVANRVVVGGTAKLQSLDPQHPFPNHPNGNLLPTQIMGRIFVWTS
ncbi:MAG: hypothetical protein ACREIT_09205, partial [Tepidisphaeraceae bacterium]